MQILCQWGVVENVAPMGLTFIAFEGYEIIVQTGEESKENIPRAILYSLTAVVVLYCLIAFVSMVKNFPTSHIMHGNSFVTMANLV